MLRLRIREVSWWYWLVTAIGLSLALFVRFEVLVAVILLCGIQLGHFGFRDRSLHSFPVQVRLAYCLLLIAGLWEPLRIVHWIQFVGTTAVVLVDYCLLARLLSLLPWNRQEPFSLALVRRTIFSPPVRGSILQSPSRRVKHAEG